MGGREGGGVYGGREGGVYRREGCQGVPSDVPSCCSNLGPSRLTLVNLWNCLVQRWVKW